MPIFDGVRDRVLFNVQIKYSNTMIFKISLTDTAIITGVRVPASASRYQLQDNSPTNQLAVSQVADWITRGLVNSPTANF